MQPLTTKHSVANVSGISSSNENKISDGGRERASLGVKAWKSSQKWNVQRSAVRSIVWLGDGRSFADCGTILPLLTKPFVDFRSIVDVQDIVIALWEHS